MDIPIDFSIWNSLQARQIPGSGLQDPVMPTESRINRLRLTATLPGHGLPRLGDLLADVTLT